MGLRGTRKTTVKHDHSSKMRLIAFFTPFVTQTPGDFYGKQGALVLYLILNGNKRTEGHHWKSGLSHKQDDSLLLSPKGHREPGRLPAAGWFWTWEIAVIWVLRQEISACSDGWRWVIPSRWFLTFSLPSINKRNPQKGTRQVWMEKQPP